MVLHAPCIHITAALQALLSHTAVKVRVSGEEQIQRQLCLEAGGDGSWTVVFW